MNPLLLKWGGLALVAAVMCFISFEMGSHLMERKWLLEKVQAEKDKAKDALSAQGVSSAYELRVRDLEDAVRNKPPRVVRLCNNPVPVSGPANEPDGPPAEGIQPAAGPDIGPGLQLLAFDADKCAEQLGSLQEWIRTVAKTPGK